MKAGELTNNGFIVWIDKPSRLIDDPLVKTTNGIFRLSELQPIFREEYLIRGTWFTKLWFGKDIVEKTRLVPIKNNE